MVEDVDPQNAATAYEPFCELEIVPARLETTRRVIVKNDESGGIVEQSRSKDFGRLDWRLLPGTDPQIVVLHESVTDVQAEEAEHLSPLPTKAGYEVLPYDLRALEKRDTRQVDPGDSPSELERGTDGSRLGGSDSGSTLQLLLSHARNTNEAAGRRQQVMRLTDRAAAGPPDAQENSQKLRLGEAGCTVAPQTFAWPLIGFHVADSRAHVLFPPLFGSSIPPATLW